MNNKKHKIQISSEKDNNIKIVYYPSLSEEWYNNVYNYKQLIIDLVIFVYSIYRYIEKMLLTQQGLILLFIFGLLTEDIVLYYKYLYLLYTNIYINNFIKSNKKILHNYPIIRTSLLIVLDIAQCLLLGIILNIITNRLISFLNNVLGYILRMNSEESNKTDKQNYENNNKYENNNNGKSPNDPNHIFTKDNDSDSDSDSDEDDRKGVYSYNYINKENTPTQQGEGVETTLDKNNRKICNIHWINKVVDGKVIKDMQRAEYYNEKGILYKTVVFKNGKNIASYEYKPEDKYR